MLQSRQGSVEMFNLESQHETNSPLVARRNLPRGNATTADEARYADGVRSSGPAGNPGDTGNPGNPPHTLGQGQLHAPLPTRSKTVSGLLLDEESRPLVRNMAAKGDGLGSELVFDEDGTKVKALAVNRKQYARRLSAFDHAARGAVNESTVNAYEVQQAMERHNITLVMMRTEEIDAMDLFRDTPLVLADEPVSRLRTEVHNLPAFEVMRKVMPVKLMIDGYALCIIAAFAIIAALKQFVFFPNINHDDANYFDIPLYAAERGVQTSLTLLSFPITLRLLYGRRVDKVVFWAGAAAFFFSFTWPIFFCTHCILEYTAIVNLTGSLGYFVAFICTVIFSGIAVRRMLPSTANESILRNLAAPQVLGVIIMVLYTTVLPVLWSDYLTTDMARAVFRLFIHPVVFECALLGVRSGARGIRLGAPGSSFSLVIYLLQINALYGRVLVMATSSTTTTVIIAIILSLEEVLLRLSVGARDRFIYKLIKGKKMSRAEAKARFNTPRALRLRGELVAMDMCLESAAMCSAGIGALIFGVAVDGVQLSTTRVLTDMFLQIALEYVTDVLVMLIELRLNVPVLAAFRTRGHNRPAWHFAWTMFFAALGSWYAIGVIYDPYWGFLAVT